jgi:hypothetical protein
LFPDQVESQRLVLAGTLDDDEHLGPRPAPEAMLDHILEIAPLGRFAVNVGDDVAELDSGKMGWPAGYKLPDLYPAVFQGNAVNADPSEIFRGIAGLNCSRQQGERKRYDESLPEHSETIPQGQGEVKQLSGGPIMRVGVKLPVC